MGVYSMLNRPVVTVGEVSMLNRLVVTGGEVSMLNRLAMTGTLGSLHVTTGCRRPRAHCRWL